MVYFYRVGSRRAFCSTYFAKEDYMVDKIKTR